MTSAVGPLEGPVFLHLARMTDERGLFEHALHDEPRPEHGYCVDDAARGLVVVSRQADHDRTLSRLNRVYLDFVLGALAPDGSCHNRMGTDGGWDDEPTVGDWWGRAAWGLGVAAADAPTAGMRARALAGFRVAAQQRSPDSRAMAFAALGAGRLLRASPGEPAARDLLRDCAALLSQPGTGWTWPEPRLRYANAAVAEALVVAGDTLCDDTALRRGIELLEFLVESEVGDHVSVTPAGGRGPGQRGPGFDQQPIEVAALAEACTAAFLATAARRWLLVIDLAWRWFLGENDSRTPMFDPATGGGYDGLERGGRNENQGAESTLAMLATAQQAHLVRTLR